MDEITTFYYKKPKKILTIYLLFIIILIIIIIYSYQNYTYDKKEILVINNCIEEECTLKTTLNYEEERILSKNPIIKYNSKTYKINKIIYDEPYLSNEIPVTDVTIETDLKEENKILKISIYYNKQRIIKKIKNIIERN